MSDGRKREEEDADDILDAIANFLNRMERPRAPKDDPVDGLDSIGFGELPLPMKAHKAREIIWFGVETARISNLGRKKYSDEELRMAMELERVE